MLVRKAKAENEQWLSYCSKEKAASSKNQNQQRRDKGRVLRDFGPSNL